MSHQANAQQGVTDRLIRIGGVMDLEGRSRGLGLGMKAGIEAAIRNQRVKGRRIEFVTVNDSYTPAKTIEATNSLITQGIFVMIGNVGTPTAKVSLPILAQAKVPAVGFFTGAGILRPGVGDIINFRASYVQETAAVIRAAIESGLNPAQICAYVQNDAYGMAGVIGIRRALSSLPGTEVVTKTLDVILQQQGENPARNNLGPVGVYQRNTFTSRDGYQSLKNWERVSQAPCKVVVTVGTYNAIAKFAAYSRYKGDNWIISAVSFTGADNFHRALADSNINDRVIMTQVVPPLDSELPIVAEARQKLGDRFGWVSLEGYIVGKLWLTAMESIEGPITRTKFLDAVRGRQFDLGGLLLDFSDDNQGSDLVVLTNLTVDGFKPMSVSAWDALMR
ncbi:MAG: ABC transporter substrate-binding protein [Gammaproteobacteria bacterium]|nr:ABC transporter substrate-binding protein [Gammaproteobacteria bacterium]NIM74044.1 ABC transporter substrate-binding protein [Gammaproteobacteria bacterium]NIN38926.1 ABC transporter substrate-binding protein [Gammaproteobacteria bacterium]NIO25819.1 ABC transporter substrate-binding protein [Gammaproteobacteria bacterium]NIO66450.1 ABC transporter substrate-binding protein [Gammaproteobacteria bacterium]